jgi:hypothetical protein
MPVTGPASSHGRPVVAATERHRPVTGLVQEEISTLRIDDERHALIWIHDAERSVSVLVDRPLEGADTVRVVGLLGPEEGHPAIGALVEDYRRNHCAQPAADRAGPRPLEPTDLSVAAWRWNRGG